MLFATVSHVRYSTVFLLILICLQCVDTVGWASGGASSV